MAVKSKHGAGGEYSPDWRPKVRSPPTYSPHPPSPPTPTPISIPNNTLPHRLPPDAPPRYAAPARSSARTPPDRRHLPRKARLAHRAQTARTAPARRKRQTARRHRPRPAPASPRAPQARDALLGPVEACVSRSRLPLHLPPSRNTNLSSFSRSSRARSPDALLTRNAMRCDATRSCD